MAFRFSRPCGGRAAGFLGQALPPCPAPQCLSCAVSMDDVRPIAAEVVSAQLFRVPCIVVCPRCRAQYIGFRSLGRRGTTLNYLDQEFERYDPEVHSEQLKALQAGMQRNPQKFFQIMAKPVG